jgi:hypothetical protein
MALHREPRYYPYRIRRNRMKHPLDGAKFKVVRAQEHLDALKVEIGHYLDTQPYEFPIHVKDERAVVGPIVLKDDPPLRLSGIIGDCVGNLRASLDYVAWQLAMRHYPNPLVPGRDRLYFPIFADLNLFNSDGSPKLARYHIPAPALDLIESIQPYHAGYEPLGFLGLLTNEDKHRLPLLTVACVDSVSMLISGRRVFRGGPGITEMAVSTKFYAFNPGSPEEPPPDVKVKGQATLFVAFQNPTMPGGAVDWALENLVKCVADIIPRFDSLV